MTRYIDAHRDAYGVELICRTLQIAPSSYYAAKTRPPSARQVSDAALTDVILRVHRANFGVYGMRKLWKALGRLGVEAGRDQVGRLMRGVGLQGVTRTQRVRTTKPAAVEQRPADLVERVFAAAAPNRLWLADLTYVWTVRGFVYTAFVVDAFSRRIVGWQVSASLQAQLALDALEMAIWARGDPLPGLVHHSDRGVQYLSIRYTERLASAEAVSSVGSRGDSYDNALAETVNGLYKAELIRRHHGPWRSADEVELATAEWVEFWNNRRLHEACGYLPPAEFEAAYHARQEAIAAA
jgi:putative transposase